MRNAVMVIKRVKYLILITIIGVIYIEPVLGFNPESETVTVSFNPEFKNDGTKKWIEETNNLSRNFTIYYPINLWKILPEYADNAATLENINNFISRCLADTTLIIKHIKITGSCSVDGSVAFNNKLSAERFSHFMKYLDKKYPGLYDYPVTSEALGENWNLLRKMVAASDMSSKVAVLNVIDNNSNGNEKLRQLKRLEGRKPYTYMLRNYFPQLRYSDIAFSYDSVYYVAVVPEEIVYEAVEEVNEPEPAIEVTYVKKPLFALKTNMLLDVMTALNVEIEVPVGKRYSLALEWMFPWWKHQKNKESSKPWKIGRASCRERVWQYV